MARKISHTKRGTYYNGPTGRRKVSDPLGTLFSAAGALGKASKSSKKRKSTMTDKSTYSGYSNDSYSLRDVWGSLPTWKKVLNYVNMVLIPLIVIIVAVQMCSGSTSKSKHRKRHRHIPGTQFSMEQPRLLSGFVCPLWKYE